MDKKNKSNSNQSEKGARDKCGLWRRGGWFRRQIRRGQIGSRVDAAVGAMSAMRDREWR